ncbi:MAG: MerR family transcriptional regulator [Thermoleophilia bacterium]|nr:MerR family transcriptional regulator [Thermoleophilia bacterium]
MTTPSSGYLRIGELARRAGVRPDLLRAWEARYALLRPSRSAGGFRLYSADDERRVHAMRAHLARGLSAAEAARLVATAPPEEGPSVPERGLEHRARQLRAALDAYDDVEANRALDRLLATLSAETVLADVVLPYLAELGERWEGGEVSVAQEHFASNLLRERLLALARGWGQGTGPRVLLACAPGELHDLGLIVFGLALRARGWRIVFLGPNTPPDTLADAARTLAPDLVVVAATSREAFEAALPSIGAFAQVSRVALAGRGASEAIARAAGAAFLDGDPISAAEGVSERGVRAAEPR